MMYAFCNYLVLTKFENFIRLFGWYTMEDRSYEFIGGGEKTIGIGIGRVSRETTFNFRMH
jgi:hypothetical protein